MTTPNIFATIFADPGTLALAPDPQAQRLLAWMHNNVPIADFPLDALNVAEFVISNYPDYDPDDTSIWQAANIYAAWGAA